MSRNTVPHLIQRQRTKGWKMPDGVIYVGRPTKWANPFPVSTTMSAEDAVRRYRNFIHASIRFGGISLEELKGRNLACWCGNWTPGEPEIDCHGVVLLQMANDITGRKKGVNDGSTNTD